MAITTLDQLQQASAVVPTQTSQDGTSTTTLRVNPTALSLASGAGAVTVAPTVSNTVTVASVTGTVSSFTVGGNTVILVEGPQGPAGATGPQGNQGVQGVAGVDVNPIPVMSNKQGEYLTNDGQGGLMWHDLNADIQVEIETFKKQINRQLLVNNIVFGS